MRVAAGLNPVFGPIRGSFWTQKQFLVQNEARFGLRIGFWRNPRRVLGFESVFGAILAGFRASNQFLAQSSAGFGLQISFWRNPRRVSGFKSVFGAILGEFGAPNRFLVQSSAGTVKCLAPVPAGTSGGGRMQGTPLHGYPADFPASAEAAPTPGTWPLLGVEASGLLSCLSVVRWLDKQFNISTTKHLNI